MTRMTIFDTIDGIVGGLLGKKKSGSHGPGERVIDRGETAAEQKQRFTQLRRAATEQAAAESAARARKIYGT